LPKDCVVFGEIALSGDVRPASQAESRLKEAAKLGFARALVPAGTKSEGLRLECITDVGALVRQLGESHG
jgi:DNA repair protein RadA/Sms